MSAELSPGVSAHTGGSQAVVAALLVVVGAGALQAGVVGWRARGAAARARSVGVAAFWPADRCEVRHVSPTRTALARLLVAPAWVGPRLADTDLVLDPATAWAVWVLGAVAVIAWAAIAAGVGAGVLAAGVTVGSPCLGWRLFRHRGEAALEAGLPAAVEAVAAGLRTGASLRQAVGEAAAVTPGALGADLALVAEATERGSAVVAALEAWAVRRPLPGVRLIVAALCLSAETGGAAAQAVDAVAATLRQRLAAQGEARALATQARASAAVMAAAPVAFCAVSAALDPRSSAFLLRTPLGLALLAAGLGLDAAGAVWMARLTRVAT